MLSPFKLIKKKKKDKQSGTSKERKRNIIR